MSEVKRRAERMEQAGEESGRGDEGEGKGVLMALIRREIHPGQAGRGWGGVSEQRK